MTSHTGRLGKFWTRTALGLALGWLLSTPASAEAGPAFRKGAIGIGAAGGYAEGFGVFGSNGTVNEKVRMGAFAPHVSVGLSDVLADSEWYRGQFSLLIEPHFLWNERPTDGFAWGGGLVFRYHWLRFEEHRVVPFYEFGGGLMSIDFDLREQRDGFNFLIQSSLGLHFMLTPQTAITTTWRYHHISNAGSRPPNVGINSNLFLLGFTTFLD